MRLYLHIGTPKTGSTALQSFLAREGDWLNAHGFIYPEAGREGPVHTAFSAAFGVGPEHLRGASSASRSAVVARLLEELRSSGLPNAVVSSEYFSVLHRLSPLKECLRGFDVRPVVYLRRQDRLIESLCAQSARRTRKQTFDGVHEFVAHQLRSGQIDLDYWRFLEPWARAFGRAKIVVRVFEPTCFVGGELHTDFADAVGLPAPLAEAPRENVSLSLQATFVLCCLWFTPTSEPIRGSVVRACCRADRFFGARLPACALLTPQERSMLLSTFHRSNARTARTYLDRESLFPPVESKSLSVGAAVRRPSASYASYVLAHLFRHDPPAGWAVAKGLARLRS